MDSFNANYVFGSDRVNPANYYSYLNYYSGFYFQQFMNLNASLTGDVSYTSLDANGSNTSGNSSIDVFNSSPKGSSQAVDENKPMDSPVQAQPQGPATRTDQSTRKCTLCSITKTCKWRNVKSKDGILCNACFIYQRKYDNSRPLQAQQKYKRREEKKHK